MRLNGKRILLGVTGSIAAYKAVELLRLLTKAGAEVQVVMTEAATKFVAPLTFETLSRQEVLRDTLAFQTLDHFKISIDIDRIIFCGGKQIRSGQKPDNKKTLTVARQ